MDLICFSHLRWNFVYQRPQHLMVRFARNNRVFFVEEPVFDSSEDYNEIYKDQLSGVHIVVPHLSANIGEVSFRQRKLLDALLISEAIREYIAWYYSPMALLFSVHLEPRCMIYDCMDELSAFKFAPAELKPLETKLLQRADIVFTGGHSLYEAKKSQHDNIHAFPSSIDKEHFHTGRFTTLDPDDQQSIPHPRLGFCGVIDERFDIDLIEQSAIQKPEWQFVFIGPVVKIDPTILPKLPNIHYLGCKSYQELPMYMSGWDICLIPFVLNESTRFISPTKTPEYLAAGKPVISTPINDVVESYGALELVYIIKNADELIAAADYEFHVTNRIAWLENVDHHLSSISWDKTYQNMHSIITNTIREKYAVNLTKQKNYV